jgi:hypothetical protein
MARATLQLFFYGWMRATPKISIILKKIKREIRAAASLRIDVGFELVGNI